MKIQFIIWYMNRFSYNQNNKAHKFQLFEGITYGLKTTDTMLPCEVVFHVVPCPKGAATVAAQLLVGSANAVYISFVGFYAATYQKSVKTFSVTT